MKVFWTGVTVAAQPPGWGIHLDTRPLRTPGKAELILPTEALAEAVAAEWRSQSDEIDPAAMPLTRSANSAIDRVSIAHASVVQELADYGGTDLLCHRASHPEALARRQAEAWDPLLAWAGQTLSAPLTQVTGIIAAEQPSASLTALRNAVSAHDPWELTALHALVTLSGSLVLGLATSHNHLTAATAWDLSRVDEDWNIAHWGEDAEAARLTARKKADFLDAARLLKLLRT